LADEVGLEKTIEAGNGVCPKWAGRKQRLVIVWRAAMRQQWAAELLGGKENFERLVAHNAANLVDKATLGTVECKYIVLGKSLNSALAHQGCRAMKTRCDHVTDNATNPKPFIRHSFNYS